MKIQKLKIIALTCGLLCSVSSHATEITPLFGLQGGGELIDQNTQLKHSINSSSMYGFIISTPYEQGKTLELYYSHQNSEIKSVSITPPPAIPSPTTLSNIGLSVDYLQFGGTTPISREKQFTTFASGGLGITYLTPDLAGLSSELRASLNFGLGLKWPINKHIALRLETRAFATLFNNNSSLFCNGGCSLTVKGSFLLQGEVSAGLAIAF